MLISEEMKYFHGGNPTALREKDDVSERGDQGSPESSIPPRYRNGQGGIDLEQVKRDQHQARRAFIRAMVKRLGKLRGQP